MYTSFQTASQGHNGKLIAEPEMRTDGVKTDKNWKNGDQEGIMERKVAK